MAYCDVDSASNVDNVKSTFEAFSCLCPNLVVDSPSYFKVLCLLHELQVPISTAIIYCISSSTYAQSHNHIWHSRTKHLDLDLLFVREKVLAKFLVVTYIPAQAQIDRILTKPMTNVQFFNLKDKHKVLSKKDCTILHKLIHSLILGTT